MRYSANTALADGRHALVVDPGSVANLAGDAWARKCASLAAADGRKPEHTLRQEPLNLGGVGRGAQQCDYDCTLQLALQRSDGTQCRRDANITAPAIIDSDCPGLLGLDSLTTNRALWDFDK